MHYPEVSQMYTFGCVPSLFNTCLAFFPPLFREAHLGHFYDQERPEAAQPIFIQRITSSSPKVQFYHSDKLIMLKSE